MLSNYRKGTKVTLKSQTKSQGPMLSTVNPSRAKNSQREMSQNKTHMKENICQMFESNMKPQKPDIFINNQVFIPSNDANSSKPSKFSVCPFPIFCDETTEVIQSETSQSPTSVYCISGQCSRPEAKRILNDNSLQADSQEIKPRSAVKMHISKTPDYRHPLEHTLEHESFNEFSQIEEKGTNHHISNGRNNINEYELDILYFLKDSQSRFHPKWNYMMKQPDITFGMRAILVDWLVEVGEEYNLSNETIHLSVNYIDRFLSFMSVQRVKLQLVGTACMFIAAKFEEIYPPDVSEFVYITDDTYTKKQVLRMEQLILKVLNFDLAIPSVLTFLKQFSSITQSNDEVVCLAMYLSELSLLDGEKYLRFQPTEIAAAALALARHTLGLEAWPDIVANASDICVEEFKNCLVKLHETFQLAPSFSQQAIQEKYKHSRFYGAALVKPVDIF